MVRGSLRTTRRQEGTREFRPPLPFEIRVSTDAFLISRSISPLIYSPHPLRHRHLDYRFQPLFLAHLPPIFSRSP